MYIGTVEILKRTSSPVGWTKSLHQFILISEVFLDLLPHIKDGTVTTRKDLDRKERGNVNCIRLPILLKIAYIPPPILHHSSHSTGVGRYNVLTSQALLKIQPSPRLVALTPT